MSGTDRSACTIMDCSGEAEYGYWMPDLGQFSRAKDPEHDLLDDGDLAPYVCESCRDRMAASPHWDGERFVDPREKLIADGGTERLSVEDVVDHEDNCAACGVHDRAENSRYCAGCRDALVRADGGTQEVRRDEVSRLESDEGYPIYLHNVGGKEPDGTPTRLGKWTFGTKMVRDVVLDHVHGRVLNACAGKTRLQKRGCEFFRNDIDEDRDADLHVDVREIHRHLEAGTFDSAILDPPFDPGRAAKLYEGWHGQEYANARDAVAELVCPGGVVVELGWNSWSLSDKDGWEAVEHHLFRQSSFKGDVHLTVDRKVNQQTLIQADGGCNDRSLHTDADRSEVTR